MSHIEGSTRFGSEAFALEYHQFTPKTVLFEDIKSYIGEYRLIVPQYQYELHYTQDQFERYHLVSPHDDEPMIIKCQRAIEKRKNAWKNTSREEAEYQCVCRLETQLATTLPGDMIVWTSPPGPPEDGYGSYGFFYAGQVLMSPNFLSNKRLLITAFRIENQSVVQCRQAIAQLTGEIVNFQTAEDCISQPKIVRAIDKEIVQSVLTNIFHFRPDKKREQLLSDISRIIKPQVYNFSDLLQKGGSREDIQKGFWALDNYVISLYQTALRHFDGVVPFRSADTAVAVIPFEMMVAHFGQTAPPIVTGSCGSTGERKSSNIFNNSLFSVTSLFSPELSANFICPNCRKESTSPVGDSCPKCGITKDEAEKKGLTIC